ncbi:MAG: hypothetical protein Q4G40_00815 [Brachybacterium sp.]|nr:hypothetical protein [Brachybacterium sp.]
MAPPSVVLAVIVNAAIASRVRSPSFAFDEIVLLQFSRFFAGDGTPVTIRGAGYYPGWSVLMAPVWWVTDDPALAYRLAIGLGVLVAIATIWPLSRVLARLGLSGRQAVTVAALVMCMPARTVQSANVMSEKPLFLAMVLVLLAAIRVWERPTMARMLVFVLATGLMGTMHSRALVLVLACAIWVTLFALRSWRTALVGLVALVPVAHAAQRASTSINELLGGGMSQGERIMENLAEERFSLFVRSFLGQTWLQTVGSLGFFLIGAVALLVLVGYELRRHRAVGPACLTAAFFAAVLIISVISWADEFWLYQNEWRRLDVWIYGRYVDPAASLLVAVGVATLVRGVRTRVLLAATFLAAVIIVPTVLWLALDAPTYGYVTPAHLAAVMPWFSTLPLEAVPETWTYGVTPSLTNENRFWLLASIPTVITLGVLWALGSRRLRWAPLLVAVLVVAAAAGTVASIRSVEDFERREGGIPQVAVTANRIVAEHEGTQVGFDLGCTPEFQSNALTENLYAYWVHPSSITLVAPGALPEEDLVIACWNWPQATELSALPVLSGEDGSRGYRLWVMPGPLQDELAAAGEVGAPEPPTPDPSPASRPENG